MAKKLFLALSMVILCGCAGESRYAKTGDHTYELEMKDNGTMSKLNASRLFEDWNSEALKLCPAGYTVLQQTYVWETVFEPARLIGSISCK